MAKTTTMPIPLGFKALDFELPDVLSLKSDSLTPKNFGQKTDHIIR